MIDLSKKFAIVVTPPKEDSEDAGLVCFDGADELFTNSKQRAMDHAKEMKETFPKCDYTVYELIKVEQ